MKKILIVALALVLALSVTSEAQAKKPSTGFDQFGYNLRANLFNGTGLSWCQGKLGWTVAQCEAYLGAYAHDKLIMKWNAEWARGNRENWNHPPYKAWENNEWNGAIPGGSGAVWHYKIVWVGDCVANPALVPVDGYCIWGQFVTIMDQGKDPSYGPGHFWFAHAKPTGYGAY